MEADDLIKAPSQATIFLDRQSDLQWDALAINVIPSQDRLEEPLLYSKKWWDYRHLHPAKATTLFAHAYGRSWRNSWNRRAGETPFVGTPFRSDQWNPFAEAPVRARSFWKARRICDEIGIPYTMYCALFFSVAEDYFTELPRPQEMWRKDVIGLVIQAWDSLESIGHLRMPDSDIYHIRYNWQDLQCQHEWEEFYVNWLEQRPTAILDFHLTEKKDFLRAETAKLMSRH